MASKDLERRDEEETEETVEDEDTGAQVAPIIRLEEVSVTTGEEEEDTVLDLKSKLYRFDKYGNQWKERGVGTVKLLKHKESGKIRLVMRQSKTLKICANHLFSPTMNVQVHAGNEKSCVWHASDFADGELKDELFSMRFASIENCKTFMDTVQEIAETQEKKEENKDATETVGLLEKLSVVDDKCVKKDGEESLIVPKEDKKEEAESKELKPDEGKESKLDADTKDEDSSSSTKA